MAHRHSVTDHPGQLISIVSLSIAAAAVGTYFLTPKNGQENRQQVKIRAKNISDKIRNSEKLNSSMKTMASKTNDIATQSNNIKNKVANKAKSVLPKYSSGNSSDDQQPYSGIEQSSSINEDIEHIRKHGER